MNIINSGQFVTCLRTWSDRKNFIKKSKQKNATKFVIS